MTSQGSPGTRFRRSIEARNVFLAETAAFEMGSLSLEDALQLVVLYAEAEDDKFDKAAVRWLGRLLLERPMTLAVVAHSVELVSQLRGPGPGGLLGRLRRSRGRRCPGDWSRSMRAATTYRLASGRRRSLVGVTWVRCWCLRGRCCRDRRPS